MRRKYNCPFYNYTILEWYEDQIRESDQKGTETEHCKICELGIKMWGKFLFQAVFWIKNFMKGNIYRHQCWNPSLTKGPPIWVRMFRSGVRLRILHRNNRLNEKGIKFHTWTSGSQMRNFVANEPILEEWFLAQNGSIRIKNRTDSYCWNKSTDTDHGPPVFMSFWVKWCRK